MLARAVAVVVLLASAVAAAADDAPSPGDRAAIATCLDKKADAPETCVGTVYNACIDEPRGSSTYGMGMCARRETLVWQAMIDANLAQLRNGTLGKTQALPENRPPENRRAHAVPGNDIIEDMERTWLLLRAKMCDTAAMAYEGGSLSRVIYGQCMYEEAARHALWLKSLADDVH